MAFFVDGLNIHVSVGETGRQDFYEYLWSASGLEFSPDGRYLAYCLNSNAVSFSMDSVELQVTDLQTGQPIDLGKGTLAADWFAWSPDSKQLANIVGEGRWPTTNKKLQVLNTENGQITDYSQQGELDTDPVWTSQQPWHLVFYRGSENPDWGSIDSGLPVPGQRILMQSGSQAAPLTTGTANTEDEIAGVSPDGQYLAYLRLSDPDHGALCLKCLDDGQEKVLLSVAMPGGIRLYSTWAGTE